MQKSLQNVSDIQSSNISRGSGIGNLASVKECQDSYFPYDD